MPPDPPSLAALEQGSAPFVMADGNGCIVSINAAFHQAFGWREAELVGQSLSLILPEAYRMTHQLGFSRFHSSEQSQILGHPLRLATLCRDGRSLVSEHFIVAERGPGGWRFGATLTPLESPAGAADGHP
ncbi:MAG: PAS domain S-box protein [Cyanobacteriota bacterium]|nr:PAS domain S-box protein [Cyanobacteriota bacterium]